MADKIKVAIDGTYYPPFSFLDDQGGYTGFDVDIATALCHEMAAECAIVATAFEGILEGLQQNRYDMVVAGISPTPEREAKATFTKHYYRARSVFIGRRDSSEITIDRRSLTGKVLTCQSATLQEEYLRKHFDGAAIIRPTESVQEAFDMVSQGKADLLLSDTLTSYHYLVSDAGANLNIVGLQPEANKMTWSSHIQVRKNNLPLRDKINAALDHMRLSGVYHKINKKYFPFSIY